MIGSGGVATANIADAAVTLAKMANLAQDQFIGRTTASTGVPETATITAAARTVLDDTSVSAMRTTLGALGSDVGAGAVGMMALMKNGTGGAVSSGSTAAGTNLNYVAFDSSGALIATTAATGTWRNVSGVSISPNESGTFQRIS